MEFIFSVNKDRLRLKSKKEAVSGNANSYTCSFSFSEDYVGLSVFAVFECGGEYFTVSVKDGICQIPYEVLENDSLVRMGIFASAINKENFKRLSTNYVGINVETGAYSVLSMPKTPDVWENCLEEILRLQKMAEGVKLSTNAIKKTVKGVNSVTAEDISPIAHDACVTISQAEPIEMIKDMDALTNGNFRRLSNSADSAAYAFTSLGSIENPQKWSGECALNAPKGSEIAFSCENLSAGNVVFTDGEMRLCAVFKGENTQTVKYCTIKNPNAVFTAEDDYKTVSFFLEADNSEDIPVLMAPTIYHYCYVSKISVLVSGIDIEGFKVTDSLGNVYLSDGSGCFKTEAISPEMCFLADGMELELTYNQDTLCALKECADAAIVLRKNDIVDAVLEKMPDGDEVSY